jgi:hypothetical protein
LRVRFLGVGIARGKVQCGGFLEAFLEFF